MLTNQIIPLTPRLIADYDDEAGIDGTQSAGDVAVFDIPFKCNVHAAFLTITATAAGTSTTPVVKYDKRPTAASDTSRGDGDIAHFVVGTTAAGKVLYDEAELQEVLEPGNQVVVQLVTPDAGGTPASSFVPHLNVTYAPETWGNISAAVETT